MLCCDAYIHRSMALVCYCFSNGPWKTIFIRLGYDPRKHKEAKMYVGHIEHYQLLTIYLLNVVDVYCTELNV